MSTTDHTGTSDAVSATLKAPARVDRIRVSPTRIDFYREDAKAGMQRVPDGMFDIELALPRTEPSGGEPSAEVQQAVNQAQVQLMTNVARASRATLRRVGVSFTGHLVMNVVLFLIGVISFAVAVYKGLDDPSQADAVVAAAFGGMSVASFITYFFSRPLDSVARSGPEAAWLLAMVNTYWTKLIYLNDPVRFPADMERAQKEFEASMRVYVEIVGDHREIFTADDARVSEKGEQVEDQKGSEVPVTLIGREGAHQARDVKDGRS